MILTVSPFNSLFWLSLKPGKNEGSLIMDYHNFSAVAPSTKFPISTIIEINDSIQSLIGNYFAIIDLVHTLFPRLFQWFSGIVCLH